MIRVNTDIDEYIMNDKVRMKLNKNSKIKAVSFDRINSNNTNGLSNPYKNSELLNANFDENLKEEIKKILQKDN